MSDSMYIHECKVVLLDTASFEVSNDGAHKSLDLRMHTAHYQNSTD